MKLYEGKVEGGRYTVIVRRTGEPARELTHGVYHSLTGMRWGYGGSGPADLARSILWDHLGHEPPGWLYQRFKWDNVARWPPDEDWVLSAEAIESWLRLHPDLHRTTTEERVSGTAR